MIGAVCYLLSKKIEMKDHLLPGQATLCFQIKLNFHLPSVQDWSNEVVSVNWYQLMKNVQRNKSIAMVSGINRF